MIFNTLLFIHIFAGTIALVTGGIAAITRKGKNTHRKSGKAFFLSMIFTGVSAIVMSFLHPNGFLLAIGLFSLYLTFSGWNYGRRASMKVKNKLRKVAAVTGLLFAFFMIGMSWFTAVSINLVLLIFGGIQTVIAIGDFKKADNYQTTVTRHAGRIGGAYIAAVTAFLVVNINFLPALVTWLTPTLVGSLLLTLGIAKWRKTYA